MRFFHHRRHLDLNTDFDGGVVFAEYQNVPRTIGTLVSARLATLHELDTIYGIEDVYQMLEIVSVDSYNKYLASKRD